MSKQLAEQLSYRSCTHESGRYTHAHNIIIFNAEESSDYEDLEQR